MGSVKLNWGGIKFKLYVVHLETDLQQDHEVKLRDASGPSADASSLIRNDIGGCQGVFKEVWRGAQAEVCQSTHEPDWKSVAEDLMSDGSKSLEDRVYSHV